MRNMSFALTTDQIRDRTKTVTRRIGWEFLKSGDLIRAVEKSQGLKKGETVKPLSVLRVESVRRERLDHLWSDVDYGRDEMAKEGGRWGSTSAFIEMFCASHKIVDGVIKLGEPGRLGALRYRPCRRDDEVTRIEFSYVDGEP